MAPAAPTLLPSPPPITDRIALGALTSTFPPELVDRVVEQTGRAEQRRRLLPARVVVYFVLALALYSHAAYEEVMRCLVEGLGWAQQARRGRRSWPYWHVLLADRLFVGWELWQAMATTGADLTWRVRCGQGAPKLPVERVLSDGSWLSHLRAGCGPSPGRSSAR
jgi:hypothetical protein